MTDSIHRRSFLHRGLIGAAALGLPRALLAQPAPAVQEIAPGIRLIAGAANGLVFATGEDAILVDVPAPDFEAAGDLYGESPTLINTNWRPEHTVANDALGLARARIVAHENTKLWMTNDFTVRWEDRRYEPRAADALPNDTFYMSTVIESAGETIELGYLPQAHTDGDIYVFFRRANVLAVSDLLAVDSYPVLDYSTGGWIGGFRSATAQILELAGDETLIVPGVGAPQRRSAVAAQLELCEATFTAVGQAYANALSFEEWLAGEPLAAFTARRGDPRQFLELAYRGAWGHIRELGVGVV